MQLTSSEYSNTDFESVSVSSDNAEINGVNDLDETLSSPMKTDKAIEAIKKKKQNGETITDLADIVDYYEEEFKLSVAGNYRKYRFPYKTLGSSSSIADAILKDEERLLSAYNLFKAVKEANAQFAKYETFIVDNVIATPLNVMDQYTTGDEFIYLQCWLYFEKKIRDFIPFMNVNPDGTYRLQFASASDYRWNHTDKEIFAVIHQNFYPAEPL